MVLFEYYEYLMGIITNSVKRRFFPKTTVASELRPYLLLIRMPCYIAEGSLLDSYLRILKRNKLLSSKLVSKLPELHLDSTF